MTYYPTFCDNLRADNISSLVFVLKIGNCCHKMFIWNVYHSVKDIYFILSLHFCIIICKMSSMITYFAWMLMVIDEVSKWHCVNNVQMLLDGHVPDASGTCPSSLAHNPRYLPAINLKLCTLTWRDYPYFMPHLRDHVGEFYKITWTHLNADAHFYFALDRVGSIRSYLLARSICQLTPCQCKHYYASVVSMVGCMSTLHESVCLTDPIDNYT